MEKNWTFLCRFLPEGWTKQAKKLGAFIRNRDIPSSKKLLRLLLIHIANGHSMRETVTIAKEGKICNITDVALHKRLILASEWFRWITVELLKRKGIELSFPSWLEKYRVISVDASVITEPGSTGTDWRLHYGLNLNELRCNQFIITKPKIGESFTNFKVEKNDLLIGDRAYGKLKGMKHIKNGKGDYIVRLQSNAFTFYKDDKVFNLLEKLEKLKIGEIGEWELEGRNDQGLALPIRICVIRKSDEDANKSLKKAKKEASRKQKEIKPETIAFCRYIVIATSLSKKIRAELILKLYRYRWQIEIAFKRLKSILGLGYLPKKDEKSCKAWLHGKMLVALLSEAIVSEGRFFSPWGYPIR